MIRFALALMLGLAAPSTSVVTADPLPAWSERVTPFRIAGPVYYVGMRGLGIYAVKTRAGAILVGGPLAKDAGQVERNLAAIGVGRGQLKLILNTHAHFDHAGGFARLRRDTGAKIVASAADARALRAGRHMGDQNYVGTFPATPVDRIVADGDVVRLGGEALTAMLTPGHTPGCTTWTMRVRDGGRFVRVVFPCSVSLGGNRLISNRTYPGIVADYRRSFARQEQLAADIVLPNHPEGADVLVRAVKHAHGDADAFIAPGELRRIVADARRDFEAALAKEEKARR